MPKSTVFDDGIWTFAVNACANINSVAKVLWQKIATWPQKTFWRHLVKKGKRTFAAESASGPKTTAKVPEGAIRRSSLRLSGEFVWRVRLVPKPVVVWGGRVFARREFSGGKVTAV